MTMLTKLCSMVAMVIGLQTSYVIGTSDIFDVASSVVSIQKSNCEDVLSKRHTIGDVSCSFERSLCCWYPKGGTPGIFWKLNTSVESGIPLPDDGKDAFITVNHPRPDGRERMAAIWSPNFTVPSTNVNFSLSMYCDETTELEITLLAYSGRNLSSSSLDDAECENSNAWNEVNYQLREELEGKDNNHFSMIIQGSVRTTQLAIKNLRFIAEEFSTTLVESNMSSPQTVSTSVESKTTTTVGSTSTHQGISTNSTWTTNESSTDFTFSTPSGDVTNATSSEESSVPINTTVASTTTTTTNNTSNDPHTDDENSTTSGETTTPESSTADSSPSDNETANTSLSTETATFSTVTETSNTTSWIETGSTATATNDMSNVTDPHTDDTNSTASSETMTLESSSITNSSPSDNETATFSTMTETSNTTSWIGTKSTTITMNKTINTETTPSQTPGSSNPSTNSTNSTEEYGTNTTHRSTIRETSNNSTSTSSSTTSSTHFNFTLSSEATDGTTSNNSLSTNGTIESSTSTTSNVSSSSTEDLNCTTPSGITLKSSSETSSSEDTTYSTDFSETSLTTVEQIRTKIPVLLPLRGTRAMTTWEITTVCIMTTIATGGIFLAISNKTWKRIKHWTVMGGEKTNDIVYANDDFHVIHLRTLSKTDKRRSELV